MKPWSTTQEDGFETDDDLQSEDFDSGGADCIEDDTELQNG